MLKRTKGFVSLAAAIALMLGLCSCSGKPETDPSTTADPTGIGAQAETGENNTAKDIAPESGAPETDAEEANTVKEAGTAAQTEKATATAASPLPAPACPLQERPVTGTSLQITTAWRHRPMVCGWRACATR